MPLSLEEGYLSVYNRNGCWTVARQPAIPVIGPIMACWNPTPNVGGIGENKKIPLVQRIQEEKIYVKSC